MYKKTKKYIVYTIPDQNKRSGIFFILGKFEGIHYAIKSSPLLKRRI